MDLYGLTNHLDIYMRNTAKTKFPGITKAMIIAGGVFRKAIQAESAMYMKRYIDQDPDSAYLVIQCDARKGDCSRDMAHEFFDDLFYNVLHMPSSYDMNSGMQPTRENPDFGTMPRDVAISKEILPAMNDAEFQAYYKEQMKKAAAEMAKEMGVDVPSAEDLSFEDKYGMSKDDYVKKHGFNPDDGKTIDIDDTGTVVPDTKAVGAATGTAVGAPKPIFYAVDFHAPAVQALGYNSNNTVAYDSSEGMASSTIKRIGRGGSGGARRLREDDVEECDNCGDPSCAAGEKCGMSEEDFFAPVMEGEDKIEEFFPKAEEDLDEGSILDPDSAECKHRMRYGRLDPGRAEVLKKLEKYGEDSLTDREREYLKYIKPEESLDEYDTLDESFDMKQIRGWNRLINC